MDYILATTHDKVKWYKFSIPPVKGGYELLNELDLTQVPHYGDKESAKVAARALGLATWRYVKIG